MAPTLTRPRCRKPVLSNAEGWQQGREPKRAPCRIFVVRG